MTAANTEIVEQEDKSFGLTRTERINVRIVEKWHSVPALSAFSVWMGRNVARRQFHMILYNIVEYHHFEKLRHANYDNGVLVCANHRSYIDNFAIAVRAMLHMPPDVRLIAPARTEGLFDRPWGIALNLLLTWMNIYPPIVRSSRGTKWGKQVIEILAALLRRGRVAVFIHPEGGRNKGTDPYKLLPARPGLGRIVHQTRADVYPVFLHGFPRKPADFIRANFAPGSRRPLVHAVMGDPVDFSAERAQPGSPRLYAEIAQKLNDAIMATSIVEREIRERARRESSRAGQPGQALSDGAGEGA